MIKAQMIVPNLDESGMSGIRILPGLENLIFNATVVLSFLSIPGNKSVSLLVVRYAQENPAFGGERETYILSMLLSEHSAVFVILLRWMYLCGERLSALLRRAARERAHSCKVC